MAPKKSSEAKAAKTATAKAKTAKSKAATAKTAPKATPKPVTPPAPENSPKKSPAFLPMMLAGVLIAGVAIGMVSTNQNNTATGNVDSQIEAYIRANPGLILEVVTQYNMERAEQERRQAVNLVKLDDGKTILGNPNGDITIYEFSDYNCGYCKRAFNDVQNLIASDDNIRVVIKEFPILSETSKQAAEISMAAAELGKRAGDFLLLFCLAGAASVFGAVFAFAAFGFVGAVLAVVVLALVFLAVALFAFFSAMIVLTQN